MDDSNFDLTNTSVVNISRDNIALKGDSEKGKFLLWIRYNGGDIYYTITDVSDEVTLN